MLTVEIRVEVRGERILAEKGVAFTAPVDALKDDIEWGNLVRRLVIDALCEAEDAADDPG